MEEQLKAQRAAMQQKRLSENTSGRRTVLGQAGKIIHLQPPGTSVTSTKAPVRLDFINSVLHLNMPVSLIKNTICMYIIIVH